MSEPILIDPLAFAREGRSLSGELAVASLDERVLASLADTSGTVRFALVGSVDKLQRSLLHLTVETEVAVKCQRCLQSMRESLQSDAVITLFTDEQKLDEACAADEELDAILAEPELDVMALIEDEIIMGLPLSPRHEACESEPVELPKSDKPNPFAILAQLKKNQAH
jgi:uncharacterized protein